MKNLKILSSSRITDDFASLNGRVYLRRPRTDEREIPVKEWLSNIYHAMEMNYPKFFKMDCLCKAGILAAELVMRNLNQRPDVWKENWAVVCFNAAGSLSNDRIYQQTINTREAFFPSPAVFVYTLANIVSGEICIRHHLRGESSCFIIEKFSESMIYKAMADASDTADFVLGGWVELDRGHCDILLCAVGENNRSDLPDFSTENLNFIYQE